MMKKVIVIGESALRIDFKDQKPAEAVPEGALLGAASLLAGCGMPVWFVGEASADAVGQRVVDSLAASGVDTSCVDRFTGGTTQLRLSGCVDGMPDVLYGMYPPESLSVAWPRIDPGDIVVFGGTYALLERVRPRLMDLVRHASERRAVVVYVVDYDPARISRITRVMPAILDSMEAAQIVVASRDDLANVFGAATGAEAYAAHVRYHAFTLVAADVAESRVEAFHRGETATATTSAAATDKLVERAVASVAMAVAADDEATPQSLENIECGRLAALLSNVNR